MFTSRHPKNAKTRRSQRRVKAIYPFPVGFFEIFGTGKTNFRTTFLEGFMFQKNMAGIILTESSQEEICNLSVARNITTYQVFLIYSFAFKLIGGKFYQLKKLIGQRKLTETLEVLEKSGISGDFALFVIQNIQLEVV
ncbi:MAG: hypothetical protein ACKPKQ_08595 [Dolichospermum sp.]